MDSEKSTAGKWLVFGLLGTLLLCMCLVIAAGAGSALFISRAASVSNGPVQVTAEGQLPHNRVPLKRHLGPRRSRMQPFKVNKP